MNEGLDWLLEQLWSPIVAVTAADDGRANGLISSTALRSSLLREAPRVAVHLGKPSLTRELALGSGAFAVHLLPASEAGIAIFRSLGMRSGHDGPKPEVAAAAPGETGAPILAEAVAYLEARVVSTLDADELTILLADVVAGRRVRDEPFLTIDVVRERLPPEAMAEWERRFDAEVAAARRLRAAVG